MKEPRAVAVGRSVVLRGPGTLALDGERALVLRRGEEADVALAADGPWVLNAAGVLRAHARAEAAAWRRHADRQHEEVPDAR